MLEDLHLHAANRAVTLELAEVDDQTPAGPGGLGDEEGPQNPPRCRRWL